jgi:hypothetical protein
MEPSSVGFGFLCLGALMQRFTESVAGTPTRRQVTLAVFLASGAYPRAVPRSILSAARDN